MGDSIQFRFRMNRESRIAWPMNEVYGLVLFNKLRFFKRAIGSSNRPDSGAFPCGRLGYG